MKKEIESLFRKRAKLEKKMFKLVTNKLRLEREFADMEKEMKKIHSPDNLIKYYSPGVIKEIKRAYIVWKYTRDFILDKKDLLPLFEQYNDTELKIELFEEDIDAIKSKIVGIVEVAHSEYNGKPKEVHKKMEIDYVDWVYKGKC